MRSKHRHDFYDVLTSASVDLPRYANIFKIAAYRVHLPLTGGTTIILSRCSQVTVSDIRLRLGSDTHIFNS